MRILFLENHALFATTAVEQFLPSHDVHVAPSVAEGLEVLGRIDASYTPRDSIADLAEALLLVAKPGSPESRGG